MALHWLQNGPRPRDATRGRARARVPPAGRLLGLQLPPAVHRKFLITALTRLEVINRPNLAGVGAAL